jgi:hypothetical protein
MLEVKQAGVSGRKDFAQEGTGRGKNNCCGGLTDKEKLV